MPKLKRSDRLKLSVTDWGRKIIIETGHGIINRVNEHKAIIEYPEAIRRKPRTRKKKA